LEQVDSLLTCLVQSVQMIFIVGRHSNYLTSMCASSFGVCLHTVGSLVTTNHHGYQLVCCTAFARQNAGLVFRMPSP